jgi:hypothetical protein
MLESLDIQKPLDNHIEFEWKFKFLMKIYENACWHGGNSFYMVATKWVLFPNILSLVSNSTFLLKIYAIT